MYKSLSCCSCHNVVVAWELVVGCQLLVVGANRCCQWLSLVLVVVTSACRWLPVLTNVCVTRVQRKFL